MKLLQEPEEQVIQELIEEGSKSTREDLFSVIDEIRAKNQDADPEEVMRDVTQVVDAVRKERYDKEQTTQGRH